MLTLTLALSAQLKRGDDLRRMIMGDQPSDSDDDSRSDNDNDEDLIEAACNALGDTENDTPSDPTNGNTGLFLCNSLSCRQCCSDSVELNRFH